MSPFTVNITKTSASSFSITVMDHGNNKRPMTTKISVDKSFQARLNKILNDRQSVYELKALCHTWEKAYNSFHSLDLDDYCDDDDVMELYAIWYNSALKAVYLSYAMKYHKTRFPPCSTCGHHVSDFRVVSEFMDDGEYLADATLRVKCTKCRAEMTYLKLD